MSMRDNVNYDKVQGSSTTLLVLASCSFADLGLDW